MPNRKSELHLNKARKLAEDLLNKNPTLFTSDFDANKRALDKILVVRNRALRNQIAGAITVFVRERAPKTTAQPSTEIASNEPIQDEQQQFVPENSSSSETESTVSPSEPAPNDKSETIAQSARQ